MQPDDRDAVADDLLRRARSARSSRPPRPRGRRSPSPARIARTVVAGISRGAGRPGHERGRDHDVEVGDRALRARPAALPAAPRSAPSRSRLPSPRHARRGRGSSRRALSTCSAHDRAHVEAGDDRSEPRAPSRSPAGPRRRRRARAPSPARPCRRPSSAAGRTSAAGRRRATTALYPATVACEESASIDCARVIRGIDSIAKPMTPARRSRSIALAVGERLRGSRSATGPSRSSRDLRRRSAA